MKLVEKIAEIVLEIRQYLCNTEFAPEPFTKPVDANKLKVEFPNEILKAILSDPSIVEIEVNAELPEVPDEFYDLANCRRAIKGEPIESLYTKAQQDMLKAGWVKKK